MQDDALARWRHEHSFGQDRRRPGESRTQLVIVITATMMVVEIAAGALFGSMALLADGLHMASHAVALGINAFAYAYARRHAHDASYSFGTGKVNTLGGFTGAVLLAAFALLMATESVQRLVSPIPIALNQAIWVAVLGLIVNGVSMLILGQHDHDHGHGKHEHHDDDHDHDDAREHGHEHARGDHDHKLASAYLHVLADALTSLLAIVALLAAKYFGLTWMDPFMGLVGAVLVARWSLGLLKTTAAVLLDRSATEEARSAVKDAIERVDGNRVVDLHLWCIGLNLYAAVLTVVTARPRAPEHYKALLPADLHIVHATVEVHALTEAR
jgi:cation diffusion facilitator family transporter